MKIVFTSASPEATQAFAKEFAQKLRAGDQVALHGDLGAGKTTFCKGIIAAITGLAPDEITSPTFVIIEEYTSPMRLYHADFYRIESELAAAHLPWDELFAKTALSLFEWPARIPGLLEKCTYRVNIRKSGSQRILEIASDSHD